jgi:hypothetical protein
MKVPLPTVYTDLDRVTDRISQQTRTIAVGVLALVWLFLAGGDKAPVLPHKVNLVVLLLTGGAALMALVFDYLQYLAAYWDSRKLKEEAEREGSKEVEYDCSTRLYRARTFSFRAKQVLTLLSVGLLLAGVINAL